jgi:hypothetical protein
MKQGDRVIYKLFTGYVGTIIGIEQCGNTHLYIVEWDDLCSMTGRKGYTSTVPSELKVV